MSRSTRRLAGVAVAGLCAAAAVAAPAMAVSQDKKTPPGPTLGIQILSFNDFHGNLEAPTGSSGRITVTPYVDVDDIDKDGNRTELINYKLAGGVEYLATHLKQARVGHPYTVTVAAGDMVGASPLLSAAFHDEPTVESLNSLGLDITAVGNHEFDEGYRELQRLQSGGCIDDGPDGVNNQNSCADHTFTGATFQYLAANVVEKSTGKTILPSYAIKNFNGAKVGFIGMTLKDTPSIVTASGVAGLEFEDEVATANALVPVLKEQGVDAIVVLIHQGGTPPAGPYDVACKSGALAADSPILPIARNLSPAIDMVISGHTHQPYVCNIPDPAGKPRLVTSASSFGRLYTETDVTFDRRTNDLVRPAVADPYATSANRIVTQDVPKDPDQTSLITLYNRLVKKVAEKVIGHITADVTRAQSAAGESQLGDLIADAQLADPSVVTGGQTPVIAFMNPGGIRADLSYAFSPYFEAPGDVTFGEAFTVQPFNNYLVSMTLTGQQIYDVLNQQWSGPNASSVKVLQISRGFTYTHNGSSVVDGTVALNGTPIDKAATYRIVTNNFLSDGGDNFPAFRSGTGKYFGGLDIDAFAAYLTSLDGQGGYTPGPLDRITKQ
ncbi:5'-nucleotidase [Intrasporangium oryzae NRRL B-24470]|uniref:5'-nucleotidase n=1 Tax=Intrasporangium oryzae NRRL B-24470 TaxID=1386089 RepID=W9GCK4_9MICO|nr:bifunctional metallophosphatase/5'-nucleotidase [Intrasporangium oryzae]EWT02528.1 5'-nucleotidase [Intrasporangium oryzae NRRL B-24470]